ncbi:type IX secretion system membrane protein PorP/SprF [Echinicola sp. CAU 1574]|uniref:Type IX secretion system membrane protein PorP/SprF n=1 Tax=Echinicola arenosa TaxID=2774144 RepID=A0ABR9AHV4_9BACT|nr:type IX secretion system membrane protein PorP/SprF [Echinicola arenosa]MBD8488332.1 type IX secretion system membrane protein PorP/SprF [Echinicola arenosa]
MKKRIYLCFILFSSISLGIITSSSVMAQQDAQFTQYMYNGLFYNPAYAGQKSGYRFSALHRSQWLGYSTSTGQGGAPTTQLLTASGRIPTMNFGWGLSFTNDDIGPTTNQDINLSLAYHRKLRRGTLSLGVFGGVFSSTIKYDEIDVVNPDPSIPMGGDESQMSANFGAGLLYETTKYYVGLSSRHINEPTFDFGNGAFDNQLNNHSYLQVGYRISTFAQVTFDPSILVKSVGFNNFSYDVSVIATHNDRISGGLAYRGEESLSVLFGYQLLRDRSLRLGYAFDLVVGGNEAKAPSSHEFMLSYNLPSVTRKVQKIIQRTPRFRY